MQVESFVRFLGVGYLVGAAFVLVVVLELLHVSPLETGIPPCMAGSELCKVLVSHRENVLRSLRC